MHPAITPCVIKPVATYAATTSNRAGKYLDGQFATLRLNSEHRPNVHGSEKSFSIFCLKPDHPQTRQALNAETIEQYAFKIVP
uniref:Effector protein HopAB E3 ubiquitin ligase domain-containing protein n=1 Tax=Pseudomonas syringae TaxID=317 RepID=I3W0H7_PSESX|nr:hypothetical protein [Pseudomonas syringae]AFK89104.1 hypothetical protein [Pseudomonas syringae]